MLRVSKMLLCIVTARFGLAVRQNLKVGQSGKLANAVEKIGALIQAKDKSGVLDNLRMLVAETPLQKDALDEALRQVIKELEDNVDDKIIKAFASTQATVVTKIADLDVATKLAVELKAAANTADQTLFDCTTVEQSKRVAFETAVAAEAAANAATVAPCELQESRKIFESSPEDPSTGMTCDFEDASDCNTQYAKYTKMVNGIVTKLKSDAAAAEALWIDAKNQCDSAVTIAGLREQDRKDADGVWLQQRGVCQDRHEERQLSLCSFGSALQTKCEKVGYYNDLIAEVDAVNAGPNSEPDRQAEWKTTAVTKCMLTKVIESGDLDAATVDACDSAVDYTKSVGTFDRMQEQFATHTAEAQFTCNEQTITFYGEVYKVPAGEAPASMEYTTEPFHPQVSLPIGTPAFALCSPDEQVDDEQVDHVLATPNRNEFYVWADVQTSATGSQIYSKLSKWDSWNSGAHDPRYLQGQAHGIPQIYVNDPTPGSTEDGLGTHVNVEDWFVGIERTGLVADQNYDSYRIVTGPVPAQATPA